MTASQTFYTDSGLVVFKLNDGSSLQDISSNIVSARFPFKWTVNDISTFGSTGVRHGLSIEDSTFSMVLIFNQITTTGSHTVVGAAWYAKALRAFELYPAGSSGSGNLKITGNCYVTEYEPVPVTKKHIEINATFVIDNASTFTTV
jgi:hypothetical protein